MINPAPWGTIKPARLVCGVDLGGKGAFALVDADTRRLVTVVAMPIYLKKVGGKDRPRTDLEGLSNLIDWLADMQIELMMIENPGAGFGAGGRALGENQGLVTAFAWKARLRVEWVSPATWKKKLTVPANKQESSYRAEALFVHDRHMLRGPRGGLKDGQAEAAMIALYAIDYVLNK